MERIVVKFQDSVSFPYEEGVEDRFADEDKRMWERATVRFSGLTFAPYFNLLDEGTLREMSARSDGKYSRKLVSFFMVAIPDDVPPREILDTLYAMPSVELAYVEPAAGPPPSITPSARMSNQRYLEPAPRGIDVRRAWQFRGSGGDGAGVRFIDVERGWAFDHVDLPTSNPPVPTGGLAPWGLLPGAGINDTQWDAHGTSVLGIVCARDGSPGTVGIAPHVDGVWTISEMSPGLDQSYALQRVLIGLTTSPPEVRPGDVVLLEMQLLSGACVEWHYALSALIATCSGNGLIVVEAAGNGGLTPIDIDTITKRKNFVELRYLDPRSPDFEDSGAIMVAACEPDLPHAPRAASNYGRRVNCFAWGGDVFAATTGADDPPASYDTDFNGTSAASAIVAGVAILAQGIAKARGLLLSPDALRALLSDPMNTQSPPGSKPIGVMPDLARIVDKLTT